jgi:CRP-like cAMP-binding protein
MDLIGRSTAEPPSREELGRILAEHPFMEGMSPEHLEKLVDMAEKTHFEAGKLIFQEGQHADNLYLILKGRVNLEVFNLDQDGLVILTVEDGEVLGWSWFVPPYRWRFDAKAVAPTDVLKFHVTELMQLCEEDTRFGYDFMKRMAAIVDQRLNAAKEHLLRSYVFHRQ